MRVWVNGLVSRGRSMSTRWRVFRDAPSRGKGMLAFGLHGGAFFTAKAESAAGAVMSVPEKERE